MAQHGGRPRRAHVQVVDPDAIPTRALRRTLVGAVRHCYFVVRHGDYVECFDLCVVLGGGGDVVSKPG